jgi:O-methyltransferase involved in polyketide biosynthesis
MLPGVSKTAILTLRARAEEHARADRVFSDPLAADWWGRIAWPAELDAWYGPHAQLPLALRADDIDRIVLRWLEAEPHACVIELGCGLSTRRSRLGARVDHWVDLDLPDVIELRRSWGSGGEGHEDIASSVLDHTWMDRIRREPRSRIFIAEGLLYYLPRDEVDRLLAELGRRFSGSAILFDAVGANDYPTLLANSRSVGAPALWKLEGPPAGVLGEFGLAAVPGFEPDRLMKDALARYWPRLDAKVRGAIFFGMSSEAYLEGRSQMVLGRLMDPRPPP